MREIKFRARYIGDGRIYDVIEWSFQGKQDILLRHKDGFAKNTGAGRRNCLVGFHEGAFMYGRHEDPEHMDTYLWMACQCRKVEVIGNIYENPGLQESS